MTHEISGREQAILKAIAENVATITAAHYSAPSTAVETIDLSAQTSPDDEQPADKANWFVPTRVPGL